MDMQTINAWVPSSISALRAFEAAARLLSFTKAGAEIGVTQSAISHSVREIEGRLGVMLFRRDGKRLDLTEAGARYAPYVRDALAKLRAGDLAISDPGRREKILTVSVSPSFAAKWLGPRIGGFALRHPDLDLRLSATAQHIDFADNDIDLAIRHGAGEWPALECVKLCDENWLPVCAPDLAARVKRPEDILQLPLIHHRDRSAWRQWAELEGLEPKKALSRGVTFSDMSLAIDAAVAGQGVALARSALAARDLIGGRLVCVSTSARRADIAYWIVRPKDRSRPQKMIRFMSWLRAEAEADRKALASLLD